MLYMGYMLHAFVYMYACIHVCDLSVSVSVCLLCAPWLQAAMRLLNVTTLGAMPSLCICSYSCSASSSLPAFSHALMRLE